MLRNLTLRINWHEGMLLSQHHFQQNDLRIFQELSTHLALISPFHYGIINMQLDIVDTKVVVHELIAVFPDGEIFRQNNQQLILELPIDNAECTVYVSINSKNRYKNLDNDITKDIQNELDEIQIPRLSLNVALTTEPGAVCIPICKLNHTIEGWERQNYTPPCFFISRDSYIWHSCCQLAQSLREKKIKRILPKLEALIYSEGLTPYNLYLELNNVLGEISNENVSDLNESDLPIISPYNHNDINSSILPLIELINGYLDILNSEYTLIQFKKKERFFYTYLRNMENLYIGLRFDKTITKNEIYEWINSAIIVSDFAIEKVRAKRIKGAERNIIENNRIIPNRDLVLVNVTLDFDYIQIEQNLHIFNPNNSIYPISIFLCVK